MLATILATLVILGVLIFVHELGHFLACRATGVGVEKFSIGFGPELISWKGRNTRYSISLIPFGGFVKPQGETEEELKEKKRAPQPGDFLAASVWKRMLIVTAGVGMNYVLAYVLFVWVMVAGRPIVTATIGKMMDGYPAATSGLRVGDRVVELNGKAIKDWQDLTWKIMENKNPELEFKISRAGKYEIVRIQPKFETGRDLFGSQKKVSRIGILPDPEKVEIQKLGFRRAIVEAGNTVIELTRLTYEAVCRLITGQLSFKNISGPIGIVSMTSSVVKMGMTALVQFVALLSVSLAVMNLLPIPALDGGYLFFLLLEGVARIRISIAMQERITSWGLYFLIGLMLIFSYNDLVNIGLVEHLKQLLHFR